MQDRKMADDVDSRTFLSDIFLSEIFLSAVSPQARLADQRRLV
jgi:hypothetical protein